MNLSELLRVIEEKQVAKATFANEHWYITRVANRICYCDETGVKLEGLVPLTFSNMRAIYEIVEIQ